MTPAGAENPRHGGTLRYMQGGVIPYALDPIRLSFAGVGPAGSTYGLVGSLLYDNLIRVDYESGSVLPWLAQEVVPNGDFTEWTIKLRSGVKFTDGTDYDAAAVKFNWDRQKDPSLGSPFQSTILGMTSYSAEDALTLTVRLPRSDAGFVWSLQGCLSGIASPAALQEHGAAYGASASTIAGAGPFCVEEFVPKDHITLKRNANYWGRPKPYLDEIQVFLAMDPIPQVEELLDGKLDIAHLTSGGLGPHVARVRRSPGIEVLSSAEQGGIAVEFNTSRPPLDDVRVRKALCLAYDAEGFNLKSASGELAMVETFLTQDSPFYDSAVVRPATDLVAAQALIDSYVSEHGGPVHIELLGVNGFSQYNAALQVQWSRLRDVAVAL